MARGDLQHEAILFRRRGAIFLRASEVFTVAKHAGRGAMDGIGRFYFVTLARYFTKELVISKVFEVILRNSRTS